MEELKRFGFDWLSADVIKGICWATKSGIKILSSDRIVRYDKLTQEVLDTILTMCCAGLLIISKSA